MRRLRGADRGWVRVCHDVLDRGQRSPAQRPRIGARPVVRLVRRAARRHAQPPDQRHREDRVDEQAHVPPRGTVRALAPRLAFARTPAAHRSDESLRTTRRNGESIAATTMEKKLHAREAETASRRRVAERRHSCYFTAFFTLILHPLAPRRRPSRGASEAALRANIFRARRDAGSRPRVGRKMVAAANSTLRTPKTRVGARDAQPSV